MGSLPTTSRNNSYILTMQDLLMKYSVASPLQTADILSLKLLLKILFVYTEPLELY